MIRGFVFAALFSLAGCAVQTGPAGGAAHVAAAVPVEVQILAINDFHGNLEPPKLVIDATDSGGRRIKVPAGGVAYLAAAAKALRASQQYSMTVSAGDMIGASPLVSALFLDEPTIRAMELVGVEYNAVGNHEFDKGSAELLRMQHGGCERHSTRRPCAVEPFTGAKFRFLAANVGTANGTTLFPGTAIRDFGSVQIGMIGMTLKETATLVSPAGVAGLAFADEAATANAAIPALQAAGADAIVLLIHQGGRTTGEYHDKSCPGLSGDILPIIERLDPAVDLVISGHTHAAYVCELPRPERRPLLLSSAGQYGTLISDIRLTFGLERTVTGASAENIIVQGESYAMPIFASLPRYAADASAQALVDRYVAAAAPEARRIVGTLLASVTRAPDKNREHTAGNLIADAMLAAASSHGAQIAFMNTGGVRTDLVPAANGSVTFGQIFAMQPFGNSIVVKTLTGAQLKVLLEQQFASGTNTAERPMMLLPSRGFFFAYDLSRPAGDRIVEMRHDGRPVDPWARYRVAVNNFLASGGDNFMILKDGTGTTDAGSDLDALEAWLKRGAAMPSTGRIENRTSMP